MPVTKENPFRDPLESGRIDVKDKRRRPGPFRIIFLLAGLIAVGYGLYKLDNGYVTLVAAVILILIGIGFEEDS